jgi:tetrahedral aminopeptidase
MRAESYDFLKAIEETPSVSGYEQPVARIIRKRMGKFADDITTDVHGNVIVALNPKGGPRVMLAGHMDQIGFLVNHVNDNGFIHVVPVGGIDNAVLPGSRVTVHSKSGPVEGVMGRKAVHLMKPEERNGGKIELADLAIDIGAKDKKDALEKVQIGDPITFKLGVTKLMNDRIASPALDNKVGAFVIMEALRLLSESKCECSVFAVATVQEEIGLRGAATSAYGIHPHVGIAVDVTHATDTPGNEKKQLGEVKLASGPVVFRGANINPHVERRLQDAAKAKNIAVQLRGAPKATGTDANAIQLARDGVAAGLVGIPNRYMHSPVELVCLSDLDRAAQLLAEFCTQVSGDTDWTP